MIIYTSINLGGSLGGLSLYFKYIYIKKQMIIYISPLKEVITLN